MTKRIGCGLFLSMAILAAPMALAQDSTGGAGSTGGVLLSEGVPAPSAQEAQPGTRQNGAPYVQEKITDWEIRCVAFDDREDPCQMYQLLVDQADTPTAEVTLFPVNESKFVAGARVVTPLETALLAGVTFSIDDGLPNQYPFQVCNPTGCVAQIGLTAEQVDAMKRGSSAKMTIVPFRAQQSRVELGISLAGFTGAFNKLSAQTAAQ